MFSDKIAHILNMFLYSIAHILNLLLLGFAHILSMFAYNCELVLHRREVISNIHKHSLLHFYVSFLPTVHMFHLSCQHNLQYH